MTILRTGSTPKYSEGWDSVFGKGGGKKKSAAKPAKAKKKAGKKKSKGKK